MGLALGYAGRGELESAEAIFDELKARSRTEYVQSTILALTAMAIGRRDEAVAHWVRAAEARDPMAAVLMQRGTLGAALRGQPEHQQLMKKIGWDEPLSGH